MSNKGSNDVTIKLDSRLLYGLIALLAVAGIFAIGLWIGNYMQGDSAAPVAAPPAAPADAGAALTGASDITIGTPAPAADLGAGGAATGAASSSPVHTDQVKVGDAEPRLWIPEAGAANWRVDLGQIPADKATEKDFQIENIGTAELVIEDTSASCGCTAAHIGESNLAPGAKTTLRVSYDPRVNQEFGRFVQKQIRVKSNDPLVPLAEFTITADVASQ